MNCKKELAVLYTILHFIVDFTSVFLIVKVLLGPDIGVISRGHVIITYNLIAFAGQLPIGMISDIIRKNRLLVSVGCVLACISYPVAFISPWTACIFAALGNGIFHIGAGSDILEMSMPKAGLSGLFVSTGAIGVWLAYKAEGMIYIWLCPILMLGAAFLLITIEKNYKTIGTNTCIRYNKPDLTVLISTTCLMLTIVIRSLLGMVMNFPWKIIPIWSFLYILAVVAGKALGGFIGDRLGNIKTAIISLGISAISFMFSFDYPVIGIIAVLCFNMTMPLTLSAIAGMCEKKYGFAFGLTTFALAIGFIPVIFGANSWLGLPLLVIGALISLVLLIIGLIFAEKIAGKKDV